MTRDLCIAKSYLGQSMNGENQIIETDYQGHAEPAKIICTRGALRHSLVLEYHREKEVSVNKLTREQDCKK